MSTYDPYKLVGQALRLSIIRANLAVPRLNGTDLRVLQAVHYLTAGYSKSHAHATAVTSVPRSHISSSTASLIQR